MVYLNLPILLSIQFFLAYEICTISKNEIDTQISEIQSKHNRILSFQNLSDTTQIEVDPFTIAIFMIDVRQVYEYSNLFDYATGWRIALNFTDNSTNETYSLFFNSWIPQQSGYYQSEKDGFIFTFSSKKSGTITLSTEVLKSEFNTQSIGFYNITMYKTISPYRNVFGTAKSYIAMVYSNATENNEMEYADNFLVIKNTTDGEWLKPPFTISSANSFASTDSYSTNSNTTTTTTSDRLLYNEWYISDPNNRVLNTGYEEDLNEPQPDDIKTHVHDKYFGDENEFTTLTYFPYFSNCEYYGNYIYFPFIYEANTKCKLKTLQETIPINSLSFSMNATADNCWDIMLNCRFTEDIRNLDNGTSYWFQQETTSTLFFLYEMPQDADELETILPENDDVNDEYLVPVVVTSNYQAGKIPTEVVVSFNYYQVSKTDKKLITAGVSLSGFIDPQDYPDSQHFNYTLSFQYLPLTTTQLTIFFALQWYVYFIMYIIVGLLSVGMTIPYLIYFMCVARSQAKYAFFIYIPLSQFQPLYGCILVVIPQMIYIIQLSQCLTHRLWSFIDLRKLWCDASNTECLGLTVWDHFYFGPLSTTDEEGNVTDITKPLQACRLGVVLTHTGLYTLIQSSYLFIADEDIKKEHRENPNNEAQSYDNNAYYRISWKQGNYFFCCSILILTEIWLTYFSYTDMFSLNIWQFIFTYKVIGITVENIIEQKLGDKAMLSPISSTIGLIGNFF